MTSRQTALAIVAALAVLIGLPILLLVGYQNFKVWSAEMSGRAEFAQAENNRRVKVLEAQAAAESAKSLADAEVTRAEGVAKANKILGDSLHGNEAYLRYLWIQQLSHGDATVIYVPTEANLPILEAGRRATKHGDEPRK